METTEREEKKGGSSIYNKWQPSFFLMLYWLSTSHMAKTIFIGKFQILLFTQEKESWVLQEVNFYLRRYKF